MALHLKQIGNSCLGNGLEDPTPTSKSWHLYSLVDGDKDEECCVIKDLQSMADQRDLRAALQALTKLVQVAALGQPLDVHYDKKQCHPLHRFHYDGKERVVWRIRKNSIRLPFYYGDGRLVFLTGVLVKRRDKLTPTERTSLEKQVKKYIEAEQANNLHLVP